MTFSFVLAENIYLMKKETYSEKESYNSMEFGGVMRPNDLLLRDNVKLFAANIGYLKYRRQM